jgi:cellulose synthase/poly-beta-1,6-N-acetylglucosamine synthase-like glycosyltransferase
MDVVVLFFSALAALSFSAGIASLLGGVWFRVLVRRSSARSWPPYEPPVAVIVACKGVDAGLEANLAALLDQDYAGYRVIFALDDLEDPARPVIRRVAARSKVPVSVVAATPVRNATGKAAALIRAAKEITAKDEVVAFMDSDARSPRRWLRDLVAPLQDPAVGATTTYRWYVHDGTLASAARSAWNAASTNLLFSERLNFAWGGSSALRREVFVRTYIAAKWGSALSDDMVVTQAVKREGLRVAYVPAATVLTDEPCDWRATLEWTTRQTVMMRAYDRRVTRYAALAFGTVAGSIDLGIALAVVAALTNPEYWLPALLLLSHVPLVVAKALVRLTTFRRITGDRLGPAGAFVLGSLVAPWLALYNLNLARRMRYISWRGTVYELAGPAPIRVVRR